MNKTIKAVFLLRHRQFYFTQFVLDNFYDLLINYDRDFYHVNNPNKIKTNDKTNIVHFIDVHPQASHAREAEILG